MGYYLKLAAAKTEVRPFSTDVPAAAEAALTPPPLWDNLGKLHFAVSTKHPLAQRYFDQGLKLAYAFNHAEAARAFRQAQSLDPACPSANRATGAGALINAPMDKAAMPPHSPHSPRHRGCSAASARERALLAALARRYSSDPKAERAALDTAYAEAMADVAARYPRDADIALLYAEALTDLSPWDYWEAAGARPKGRTTEILAALEKVLRRQPDHPGAIHFYIHMVEASANPGRALPYADRLGSLMPGAGHLVHMPFHIYYRVGQYKDAIEANQRAVAADEAYIAEARPEGIYPLAYYPHNVHSLMTSAQMAGDGERHHGGEARARGQPGCRAQHRLGAADPGGALLRPRPVQRARHHDRPARPRRRTALRQGHVALRARRGACLARRVRGRPARGGRHAAPGGKR
jgi:tetratricopeptide (TPR) repeat protein